MSQINRFKELPPTYQEKELPALYLNGYELGDAGVLMIGVALQSAGRGERPQAESSCGR